MNQMNFKTQPDYMFQISIGDWSCDGHEKSVSYKLRSNKPVEDVREVHFTIKDTLGIDIEEICSTYQETAIAPRQAQQLVELGIQLPDDLNFVLPDEMARIWVDLLQKADPGLILQFEPDEDIPTLHFYGFDKHGRSIGQVGYGLFE